MQAPEGFSSIFRTSPFLEAIGPIYSRGKGEQFAVGLRVGEKHCNARGSAHGGVLATLCDIALGYAMAFSSDPPASLVTASMNIDFAGTAKLGDWIESSVQIQRKGSRLAFANCYLLVEAQRIVHASAVYMVAGELPDRPRNPE
jgi:acyl-coenzyme A thioesterase 13